MRLVAAGLDDVRDNWKNVAVSFVSTDLWLIVGGERDSGPGPSPPKNLLGLAVLLDGETISVSAI